MLVFLGATDRSEELFSHQHLVISWNEDSRHVLTTISIQCGGRSLGMDDVIS